MTAVVLLSSVTERAMSLLIINLNLLPLTYIYIPNMLLLFNCVIEKLPFHISCDISVTSQCHYCDISVTYPQNLLLNTFVLLCRAFVAFASLSVVWAQRLTSACFAKVLLSAMTADRSTIANRALRSACFVSTSQVPAARRLLHSVVVVFFLEDEFDSFFPAWRMQLILV